MWAPGSSRNEFLPCATTRPVRLYQSFFSPHRALAFSGCAQELSRLLIAWPCRTPSSTSSTRPTSATSLRTQQPTHYRYTINSPMSHSPSSPGATKPPGPSSAAFRPYPLETRLRVPNVDELDPAGNSKDGRQREPLVGEAGRYVSPATAAVRRQVTMAWSLALKSRAPSPADDGTRYRGGNPPVQHAEIF